MAGSIQRLNAECFCVSLDPNALSDALESEIAEHDLVELIQQRCPHLFSARPVFLSQAHALRMHNLIRAIESVVALPAYREFVLADAAETARHPPPGQWMVARLYQGKTTNFRTPGGGFAPVYVGPF